MGSVSSGYIVGSTAAAADSSLGCASRKTVDGAVVSLRKCRLRPGVCLALSAATLR